uniref:Ryanodine receptor-like n=1 Tax=Diabrotica virgifera virgifera TaxID=50390 RepID=A0A6P7FTA9_DIAVI
MYLPPSQVGDCFVEYFMPEKPDDHRVDAFANYLVETYIEEDSTFPPQIWAKNSASVYRTTNSLLCISKIGVNTFVSSSSLLEVSSLNEDSGSGSGSSGIPDIIEGSGIEAGSGLDSGEDDDDLPELVHVDEDFYYMAHVMRLAAMLHSIVSLAMLIAYYHLKVPLAIFKREKEIARRLEFEGLYIAEQPEDDDLKSHWDKLVISAKSFPVNYWDKFIKKKVRQKYSETYDFDSISSLLGMEKTSFHQQESEEKKSLLSLIINIDWRYQIWKSGVTITDNSFLYSLWYFTFSILGNFNN